MSIKFTKPNPNIEIHLPNGKTLTGPRGTAVEEFLAKAKNDYPAPIVDHANARKLALEAFAAIKKS